MTGIIDFDRSFLAFSSQNLSPVSPDSNSNVTPRTPTPTSSFSGIAVSTDSFSQRKTVHEGSRLRIISEEDFRIDFGSDQSLFEEDEDEGFLYQHREKEEKRDRRLIDEIYSNTSTEGDEDHFSILSSSPSDVYFLHDQSSSSLSPRPSSSTLLSSSPPLTSDLLTSFPTINPLVGQVAAEVTESKQSQEEEQKRIEGRRILRRNSQPVTLESADSRRGSAVSVDSLAGRSDPGICSSFLLSADPSSIPETRLSLVEEDIEEEEIRREDSPPLPTESVTMIMDPIEPLSHVSLSGDTQPFGLSLSFDSYKNDSSDSTDLMDRSMISVREESKGERMGGSPVTPHRESSLVRGEMGQSASGHRQKSQRKRTQSPDLVPAAIQVREKRRKRKDGTTAAHDHQQHRHAHDPDSTESGDEDSRSGSSSNSSPNDTLNTPVSKKTDGASFFPTIVSPIHDPVPITGTFTFVA